MTKPHPDASNLQKAARLMWRAWDVEGTPAQRLLRARSVARELAAFADTLDLEQRRAVRRMAAPLALLIQTLSRDAGA